eukprot:TRINITY_DN24262_c0_g1_i1.p1 TRINITY_DN24262_c0_g1~~TRINITY_DN24262_c0_g1_i1.p1  ORF type:complete len:1021 (+),score=217.16 TRINITY_DN24262_c0_g1_i1:120-3182(+)
MFLKFQNSSSHSRFSLLCLSHENEVFISSLDFAAQSVEPELYEGETEPSSFYGPSKRGRIRFTTHATFFEPDDTDLPLERIEHEDIIGDISISNGHNGFMFQAKKTTHIKGGNRVAPYKQINKKQWYIIKLNHTNISEFEETFQNLVASCKEENLKAKEKIEELIKECSVPHFERTLFKDFTETPMIDNPIRAERVTPFVSNPGVIMFTDERLYFQPSGINNASREQVVMFDLKGIKTVLRRRHLLMPVAVEIFDKHKSCFFVFNDHSGRESFLHLLMGFAKDCGNKICLDVSSDLERLTKLWQARALSNYDYILQLNSLAGRTFSDLAQYPVFPWVIADYSSNELDLDNEETFRDLFKPIGALNPSRVKDFRERFHQLGGSTNMDWNRKVCRCEEADEVPFMYGTHYSCPTFVMFYLVRVAPEYMLRLQSGRFDHPDRLFFSIEDTWKGVLQSNTDVKELIPEFYDGDGAFLLNSQNLEFGERQNGEKVDDVTLPPWAKSPQDFIEKNREALESDFASAYINRWIDLVFGFAQMGPEAVKRDNVFRHISYEGVIPHDSDPFEKHLLLHQVREFGQTPRQLLNKPHPSRGMVGIPRSPLSEVESDKLSGKSADDSDRLPVIALKEPKSSINEISKSDEVEGIARSRKNSRVFSEDYSAIEAAGSTSMSFEDAILVGEGCAVMGVSVRDGVLVSGYDGGWTQTMEWPSGDFLRRSILNSVSVSCVDIVPETMHHSPLSLAGTWDGSLSITDPYSLHQQVFQLHNPSSAIADMMLRNIDGNSSSSLELITCGWDGEIKCWDFERLSSGSQVESALKWSKRWNVGELRTMDISQDNRVIVGASEGSISMFDDRSTTNFGSEIQSMYCGHLASQSVTALTSYRDCVIAGGSEGKLAMIDIRRIDNARLLSQTEVHEAIYCLEPTNAGFLTAGSEGIIREWIPSPNLHMPHSKCPLQLSYESMIDKDCGLVGSISDIDGEEALLPENGAKEFAMGITCMSLAKHDVSRQYICGTDCGVLVNFKIQ